MGAENCCTSQREENKRPRKQSNLRPKKPLGIMKVDNELATHGHEEEEKEGILIV